MPLKLNVGLARTVGDASHGSRAASVTMEMELDSTLANEHAKLQDKIRQLFSMVSVSLSEELNGSGNGHYAPGNPSSNGGAANGYNHQPSQGDERPRPATQSQVKALFAITKSKRLNLNQLVQDRFQAARPEDLSIRQASKLIDELKNGGGS